MTDSINAADFDPPLTGKQVEQVQEVVNEAHRRWLAAQEIEIQARVDAALEHIASAPKPVVEKKLSEYTSGEFVDVIKNGEWMNGTVNGVEKKLGMVYVHTERGPVTVASTGNIRPRQD